MVLWQKWRSASPIRRGAVTREQYWILRTLMERGGMKVKDIASALGTTAASASVAVKRMERAGLVHRERSRSDERVVTVALGRKGSRRLRSWRADQLASMASLFDALDLNERRVLRDLLQKAVTAEAPGGARPRGEAERRP